MMQPPDPDIFLERLRRLYVVADMQRSENPYQQLTDQGLRMLTWAGMATFDDCYAFMQTVPEFAELANMIKEHDGLLPGAWAEKVRHP